ncbi:reverse transcriptase domain-containing protein [Tanacetum coccineum]
MPFGLKNVGATYQRLVDKAFQKQIGRNLEVYVDDLVIKSQTKHETLRDIEETFHNLRKIKMKLNPKKCTFGMEEGAFLGHVVSMQGIKACPERVEAVMKLQSPQTLKEAQSLNGKLASLNRFLSKSTEKSLPFFKTLKRPDEEGLPIEVPAEEVIPEPWTLFTDRSSCLEGLISVRIYQKSQEKPSKTGKHEHEKRKSTREAKNSKPKAGNVKKSKLWSTLGSS